MSFRTPPLLEPYLALPPEASLILLTSVLGASTNWLVLRFLQCALLGADGSPGISTEEDTKVLLVSFMRDLNFWKDNAKRLGLDLEKLATKRRFAFLDGLSGLFLLQGKGNPVQSRNTFSNSDLTRISSEISNAVQYLKGGQSRANEETGKILLVIDQIDLLLAAGGDLVGAVRLGDTVMGLREQVHGTIFTLSADSALVSVQQSPLETNHAAFLLSIGHQANFIMSLRLLDTGMARDVSGVIRITRGGEATDEDLDVHGKIEEKDLLYFVGGDGGVKVFERGQ